MSDEKKRLQGCLNWMVFTSCISALGLAYIHYGFSELQVERPINKVAWAKNQLAQIIKECAIAEATSNFSHPSKGPTHADTNSSREGIDGYRIVDQASSKSLNMTGSCYAATAIPSDDNPIRVAFSITYNPSTGNAIRTCKVIAGGPSIKTAEDEYKAYGCKEGAWR